MSASLQRHYKLRPSRYLSLFISIACLLSFGVAYILPLGILVYSVLNSFILAVGVFAFFSKARLNLTDSCVAFRLEDEMGISLILRDGSHQAGKLVAGGVILPFMVLIDVRLEHGGHRSLVLLSDSMDADSFRRLRVLLRWGVKWRDPISSV